MRDPDMKVDPGLSILLLTDSDHGLCTMREQPLNDEPIFFWSTEMCDVLCLLTGFDLNRQDGTGDMNHWLVSSRL
jgi:hypothetical protein